MPEKKSVFRDMDYRQLIRRQAGKLADLLSQSPEYRQFQEARRRLEADSDNADILSDLRQQQMALRMAAMMGEDVGEENRDLENLYLCLTQDPAISNYLFAEGRFLRLVGDVEDVFSDKLDLGQSEPEDLRYGADQQLLN